jgi:Sigma-70, region 4
MTWSWCGNTPATARRRRLPRWWRGTSTWSWKNIAPLLDTAMAQLGEKDHSAIMLRFFEGKDLRQVGAVLGVTENAAKTRVSRATEKLRRFVIKRGITLSTAAIGGVIAANSVQAAPFGLATSVPVAAVRGTVVTTSTLTLIKERFGTRSIRGPTPWLTSNFLKRKSYPTMKSACFCLSNRSRVIPTLAMTSKSCNESERIGSTLGNGA